MKYIVVKVYGDDYKLLKKDSAGFHIQINGVNNTALFKNDHVTINVMGGSLVLSTDFGLRVTWDGDQSINVQICDSYAKHVCGLCGNGIFYN